MTNSLVLIEKKKKKSSKINAMKHKMYWKFCSFLFLSFFTCPELSRETRWKLTSNFCGFFGKESGMKVMRAEKCCLHGGASSKRRGKKRGEKVCSVLFVLLISLRNVWNPVLLLPVFDTQCRYSIGRVQVRGR